MTGIMHADLLVEFERFTICSCHKYFAINYHEIKKLNFRQKTLSDLSRPFDLFPVTLISFVNQNVPLFKKSRDRYDSK